jgi:peroxin-1
MFGYSAVLVSVYVFVRGCLFFPHPHDAKVTTVSFEPSSAKAVLLTNDTELSVAPKTRRQWDSEKHIVNGGNPVMKSDPAMTSPTTRTPSYTLLLRVLPASMFSDDLPSPLDFGSVIFVSQWMLSVARLEGSLPSDSKTTLIANVKRLDPPTDPAGAANPSPSDAGPIAKVLNPSGATKGEVVKDELSKVGHVRVVGMDGVPEGQMIIVGGVDGVEDWDVIRQVLGSGRWNVGQDSCPSVQVKRLC